MFHYSYSAVMQGIEARMLQVEADVSDGLPMFSLVGLLSSEAREAKDRVRISIKNSGFKIPTKRITINLSPADIRKEGTAFDLPIAIALLAAFGYVPQEALKQALFIGELSLDGSLNPVTGVLPIVYSAREKSFQSCIVPRENAKEGAVVEGIRVLGFRNLREVAAYLRGEKKRTPTKINKKELYQTKSDQNSIDFSEVLGQESTKRALEVAVSGMHNVLMLGPPGAGKSMLAKRVPTIMPTLTFEESIEISKIYSISGLLNNSQSFILHRPFRSPHHSITATALVGGGSIPKPGEISLASGGVLFLDELPEFKQTTLELLRQPLEERVITVARLNGVYDYPTDFMLIAAMNPCKCGYYPDRNRCICTNNQIQRYLGKISMPLLDRIDICTEAKQVHYLELKQKVQAETSKEIRGRVMQARNIQLERYQKEKIYFNGQLTAKNIKKYCCLGKAENELLEAVFSKLQLSARAYHRLLKVARTIADLEGAEKINTTHLSEATYYRSIDKKYWE